jgi:hypothetical protein
MKKLLRRVEYAFLAFFAILRGEGVIINATINIGPQGISFGGVNKNRNGGLPRLVIDNIISADPALFGADPTGERDSSRAIQSTVRMLTKTGGVVHLPKGFYGVNETIAVPEDVDLKGKDQ